ncbi:MAG TPA: cytochrome C oxidase subunit IV family protein [Bryobacteraceae bacterium]|nr:cytochrome C oxidase subunit IV family protein [Bryobacteraceae bacterium]
MVSRRTYAFTWLGLLGLTLLTTLLGFIDMGPFSMVAAVGIATVKAALIAGFFMHALFEGKLVRVAIAGGVIWFLILVSLTLGDYITRGWLPFPGK